MTVRARTIPCWAGRTPRRCSARGGGETASQRGLLPRGGVAMDDALCDRLVERANRVGDGRAERVAAGGARRLHRGADLRADGAVTHAPRLALANALHGRLRVCHLASFICAVGAPSQGSGARRSATRWPWDFAGLRGPTVGDALAVGLRRAPGPTVGDALAVGLAGLRARRSATRWPWDSQGSGARRSANQCARYALPTRVRLAKSAVVRRGFQGE